MDKKYLINDTIIFSPEERKLYLLSNVEDFQYLTFPATKCLFVIIKNNPNVVAKEQLLEMVWGERGMIVPLNTLYQNISSIRKALKKLSGDDAMIVTQPKKGFRFSKNITIKEYSEEVPVLKGITGSKSITNSKDMAASDDIPALDDKQRSLAKETVVFKNAAVSEYIPVSKAVPVEKPHYYAKHCLIAKLVLLVLLFIILFFIFYWVQTGSEKTNFFTDYIYRLENKCHIYTNYDSTHNIKAMALSKNIHDCESYPYVYITNYKYIPSSSSISCDKPIDSKENVHCISLLLHGVIDDD
jgi:DNA-binding winged helix-turn-helix (wHTH) protein